LGRWARTVDRLLAPLLLFVCFYLATFFALTWLRFPFVYWSGLIAACVGTGAAIAIWERGQWPLGIFVRPILIARDLVAGSVWGTLLIGSAALLVSLTSDLRHAWGTGFPWVDLVSIYLPSAVHEELLFRGYVFQKLVRWSRIGAVFFGALLFAMLHMGNTAVTLLALTNIFLGGVLLGLAYLAYQRLWFPIALHLSWNLMSGPILGSEVSGFENARSVFIERGGGPEWITGGHFGIEGSVCATLVELIAIALLMWKAYHPSPPRLT
jgi:membrane protease YdiL (CAAX protease family)